MKRLMGLTVGVALLGATVAIASDVRDYAWMDKGKEQIRERLKDPESAQFRNVFFSRGKKGMAAACGEVNSKNSFGGYVGYQRWIFAGTGFAILEKDVSDFDNLWDMMCKE